jgi:hypothetical protein
MGTVVQVVLVVLAVAAASLVVWDVWAGAWWERWRQRRGGRR